MILTMAPVWPTYTTTPFLCLDVHLCLNQVPFWMTALMPTALIASIVSVALLEPTKNSQISSYVRVTPSMTSFDSPSFHVSNLLKHVSGNSKKSYRWQSEGQLTSSSILAKPAFCPISSHWPIHQWREGRYHHMHLPSLAFKPVNIGRLASRFAVLS